MHYGAHRLAPPSYYERLRREKAKHKPKIKKVCSGWLCVNIPEKGDVAGCVRGLGVSPSEAYSVWKERSVQAHKEALNELVKQPTYNNDFSTESAYPYYDIYDQAEEQNKNNEKILSVYIGVLGVLVIAMFVGIALS